MQNSSSSALLEIAYKYHSVEATAMKGLKTIVVAQKKLNPETLKKRKADSSLKKEKGAKKNNNGAPKRPPTAFFVFMQDFRKTYKENFPDNKSVAIVAKAGGDKWKSMSESEKAPFLAKASKGKAEYEKAMEAHKNGSVEEVKTAGSEKSSSEIHDLDEQEASSSN